MSIIIHAMRVLGTIHVTKILGVFKGAQIKSGPRAPTDLSAALLAAFVSEHKDDWDSWVSLAVYAYNTSCHESTGFSPYELVFCRSPKTPLELDLDSPWKHLCSQSEYSQSVSQESITQLKLQS